MVKVLSKPNGQTTNEKNALSCRSFVLRVKYDLGELAGSDKSLLQTNKVAMKSVPIRGSVGSHFILGAHYTG